MEWTNEMVIEFLDLYEGEPIIWNPQHEQHKEKNLVYDAWKRIINNLSVDCSLKELKKKKDILMATYRKLTMKVKNSTRTGAGTNEIYKPEWFAYDKMASFLHNVYTPRGTKTTERLENEPDNNKDDSPDNEDETSSNIADPLESPSIRIAPQDEESHLTFATGTTAVNQGGPSRGKKRKAEKAALVEKRIDKAYRFLKQVADKPKVVRDESYIFSELVCLKLRALDDDTRGIAMHEIYNLLFNLKNSREQHPDMPFSHNHQPYASCYVKEGGVMNLHRSPVYGSHESSASYVSTSSTSQHGVNDNKSEMRGVDDISEVYL